MTLTQVLTAGAGVVRLPEWKDQGRVLVLPHILHGQMVPWGMLCTGPAKPETVALAPLLEDGEDRYEICRDLQW